MAEIGAPIVAEQVAAPAVSWIKRQLSYVFNFKRHVQNSNDQLHNLRLRRERIEHAVDDATRVKMEVIEGDVEYWLQSVTTVDEDAKRFSEETERAKKGCFFGFCPNVKARYQLSKKAEDVSKAAADLLLAGQFTSVSYSPAPQGMLFPTIKDYESFESRACRLDDIMTGLKDPNVNMIGVWGMGGVGKTTLVKKAAEQTNVDRIFDVVIFSEVSLNQDLGRIQEEIADSLGLKFNAKRIVGRSNELRERLQKETKILVILDNIWASLDLGELGIPFGDDHKGCKILMTSRDGQVLTRMGNNSLNIRVDALNDKEAWNLFEKMAGDVVKARNLQSLAVEITKRCAGLPILISTVASALRNINDSHTWKEALQQLEKFENDELDAHAYSALELSYNHLKNNVIKQLFLLCGQLVDTDYAIEDLFNYCMSLDSFKDIVCLEDRRSKLHKLVGDLKSKCLLLDGKTNGYVKMHDVVRMFAVSYARQKHIMFMEEYDGELEEWPRRNTDAKFSSIYFPHNYIHRLIEGLECKELKLFILHSKNRYLKIPSSFFQGVGGITVLDIKNIILPSLPPSLCCLENLLSLSLEKCELEDTTMIGELVGLEVLRFVNTDISHLPLEIRQLTGLKLLCVSKCINLEVIPRNVISSLTQLEELSMDESFVNWQAEGDNCQNACLVELKKLSKLTSLDIHIPNSNIMPNDLFSVRLKSFKILIGDGWDWSWSSRYETSQRLKLKLSTSIHSKPDVKELLKKTEDLYLDELGGVNSVCKLDREGFQRLRCLHVQRGRNFQYIVNSNTRVPSIFSSLEVLSLAKLINLEMICRGKLGVESFSKLRIVKVERCDMLKNLFSFTIAKSQLLQLQEIQVENCENMEEIFYYESEEDGRCNIVIELKQVHSLCLKFLPKITSFCSEAKLQTGDSSGSSQNMQLIPLLNGKVELPTIEGLTITHMVNLKIIWHNELAADSFCKLENLFVGHGCENLLNVFPSNMLTRLQNLRKLSIQDCKSMDKIFDLEGPNALEMHVTKLKGISIYGCPSLRYIFPLSIGTGLQELEELRILFCDLVENIVATEEVVDADVRFEFPKVTSLTLSYLSKLRSFYPGIHTSEWPLLKKLEVIGCMKLEIFASEGAHDEQPLFSREMEIFPNLEELSLSWNYVIKIWHGEFRSEMFCRLKSLDVHDLFHDKIITSFPPGFFKKLPNLEQLGVRNNAFSEMFPNGGVIVEAGELSSFCSTLKTLTVARCGRLKILFPSSLLSFCNLIKLDVCYCDGLTYLMSSPTAKSMMQLQDLQVCRCKMMTSIVECVGEGEAEDDIIFPQLKKLQIYDMPNLSSFCCSGKLAFKLPSLESVTVKGCPNLKTFCEGSLSAFKLRGIHESNLKTFCEGSLSAFKLRGINELYEKRWNGDLNTTIQTLYKERTMAIRIQRQFRMHVARRHFIAFRTASIVIQSAVRGNNARKIFKSLKGDIALN